MQRALQLQPDMSQPITMFPSEPQWQGERTHQIPFLAYTSDEIYRRELERFFYKGHWCYVGLEAEIPEPGDFKRTVVGERSVILVRGRDGAINVVENVCAHRGMRFCRERHGNVRKSGFTCPYHQWNYTCEGDLRGVPFRRGVPQDGQMMQRTELHGSKNRKRPQRLIDMPLGLLKIPRGNQRRRNRRDPGASPAPVTEHQPHAADHGQRHRPTEPRRPRQRVE